MTRSAPRTPVSIPRGLTELRARPNPDHDEHDVRLGERALLALHHEAAALRVDRSDGGVRQHPYAIPYEFLGDQGTELRVDSRQDDREPLDDRDRKPALA